MTVPLEKMPQLDKVYQILGLKDIAQRSPQQGYSQKEIVTHPFPRPGGETHP